MAGFYSFEHQPPVVCFVALVNFVFSGFGFNEKPETPYDFGA
jgi:hypothetical protein